MSDMVDMMLDGIVCQHCGSFIDGGASGYPRSCGCYGDDEDIIDFDMVDNTSTTTKKKTSRKKKNNKKRKVKKK